MAIGYLNPMLNSLSGMLGKSLVFKTVEGRVIISNRPSAPTKQSEQQRANRNKFKHAAAFAKTAMLDPAKKEYYKKKAKQMKLPNAYTAAITDYMRKLTIDVEKDQSGTITVDISKKNFSITKADVVLKSKGKPNTILRTITPDVYDICMISLSPQELSDEILLEIRDAAGSLFTINANNLL